MLFRSFFMTSKIAYCLCATLALQAGLIHAQGFVAPKGDLVPREVREMTSLGLQYLVQSQENDGSWGGVRSGSGTTGLCLMALLASGEDPNFGIYRSAIRKALRSIIRSQNPSTGLLSNNTPHDTMYDHGFAMLALSESYGAVDESDLWSESDGKPGGTRSIGAALELGVRCAITSQAKNPFHGWRYGPDAKDADTSVSGSVLMGLLAARNAGIEVPDKSIDGAINYYVSLTADGGTVGYAGGLGGISNSIARSSITCLVYSVAKRKDLKQYESVKKYVVTNLTEVSSYKEYTRYYLSQALFQADLNTWEKWNLSLIRELKTAQSTDGSFDGQFGKPISTAMNLLALALNYRFLPIYER